MNRLPHTFNGTLQEPKTDKVIHELWQQIALAVNEIPEPLSRADVINIAEEFSIGMRILHGSHADRLASFPPGTFVEGSLFFEDDRLALYIDKLVGGVPTWVYVFGTMRGTLSPDQKPAALGTDDGGFLFYSTDFDRLFRWTGAAWSRGPGEPPAGLLLDTTADEAPGVGWQLCDGSTVSRTTALGALVNVTVPNYGTAAYAKRGTAASIGPNAASGATGNNSAATTVDNDLVLSTVAVAANTHTHGPGTLELRNSVAKTFYRL